mgnify:CR=1 FL=1
MRRKLAFALVLVIGLLGLAEGAARLKYSPQTIHAEGLFEFDPDKVFRLRSNHSGEYINRPVQTNSFGHRDREISEDKAPGSTRILTPSGYRPLGQLDAGDPVLSVDRSGNLVSETISRKLAYGPSEILCIEQ